MKSKLSKKFINIENTNYAINQLGEVKSFRTRTVLKPFLISDYPAVNITISGKRKTVYIHHLMAAVYLDYVAKRGLMSINHKDGNKQNNRLDNLEVITHRLNSALTYINKKRELPTGVTKTAIGIRKFKCQISYKGVNRYLGCYMTAEQAGNVYQEAAKTIMETGELPDYFLTRERYQRFIKPE